MIPRSHLDMHEPRRGTNRVPRRAQNCPAYPRGSLVLFNRYACQVSKRTAAEENLFQWHRYWPEPTPSALEKGIRKSKTLSLSLSLSSLSLNFEGAARWHEILLKDVDNQGETRVSSRAERVSRGIGVVDSRTRHVYGRVKCKTSEGKEGRRSRGMRFIESFLSRDFVISLARCAVISVFRLDERWFDILMLARFDLFVGKGIGGGIKMLGKRV